MERSTTGKVFPEAQGQNQVDSERNIEPFEKVG